MELECAPSVLYNALIQDLIAGVVRRHTFTQWELELLLDLQTCGVRKSMRPDLLKRYQKAVNQQFAEGAVMPLRLAAFLERERELSRELFRASAAGLSSK